MRVKSKAVEEREKFEWMKEHMSAMARELENTHLKDAIRQQMHELFTGFRNDWRKELRQLVSKKDNGGGEGEEGGGGGEGELPPIRDAKEASRERIRRGSRRHGEAEAASSLVPMSRRARRLALQNEAPSPGSVLAEGGGEGGEEGRGGGA